jgi:hypothetical protein
MTLTPQMHASLAALNASLINHDEGRLLRCLEDVDLSALLSEATIREVRARNKQALTLFLCTLAVANEVDANSAQFWLDCHQSVAKQELQGGIASLPSTYIVRRLIEAAIRDSSLHKAQMKSASGKTLDWHHALELALDLRDWSSAHLLLETLLARQSDELNLLLLVRILSDRHSVYVNMNEQAQAEVDVDYLKLSDMYAMLIRAVQKARVLDLIGTLRHFQAGCLETAGHFDEAVRVLRQIDVHGSKIKTKISIARSLCKGGRKSEAIEQLDGILGNFSFNKTLHERDESQEAVAPQRKEPARFDVNRASEALRSLAQIFKDNGHQFFLVSGTLLGYAREGQLLSHDKDIDVGVIGWKDQYDICLALQKSGEFSFSPTFLKGDRTYYLPVMHNATSRWIDVFIYYPQDDKLVTGVDFFFGQKQRFAFTPFELRPVNFLDVDMYVPDDVERNLEENYGNWRVSDPAYLSHLESPSTVDKGNADFMVTARLNALSGLLSQKSKVVRRVLSVMQSYSGRPLAMSPDLLDRLSSLCDEIEQPQGLPSLEEACA